MITNPFRYGALALDDAFTDREAEVAELLSDVMNGQDVVVFAPRRYGKSSLVWRVSQLAIARDVLVAHVNLMTTPTAERLAEKLAETIHDDLASTLFRAPPEGLVLVVEDALEHVALAPQVHVRDGGLCLEDGSHEPRQVGVDVDDLLELVEDERDLPSALRGELARQLE